MLSNITQFGLDVVKYNQEVGMEVVKYDPEVCMDVVKYNSEFGMNAVNITQRLAWMLSIYPRGWYGCCQI